MKLKLILSAAALSLAVSGTTFAADWNYHLHGVDVR